MPDEPRQHPDQSTKSLAEILIEEVAGLRGDVKELSKIVHAQSTQLAAGSVEIAHLRNTVHALDKEKAQRSDVDRLVAASEAATARWAGIPASVVTGVLTLLANAVVTGGLLAYFLNS